MRQSVKETRSRIEPLLLPGNLYESLQLARAAAEYASTVWALDNADKGEQSRLPRS